MLNTPSLASRSRAFSFERDTFAFANELVWDYRIDAATGTMTFLRRPTPPAYSHRCFVMVRAARQFFNHARFEPTQPPLELDAYLPRVREVLARSPRRLSPEAGRVSIPGYEGLRQFSQAHAALLKAECGGAWRSYFVRSHWRMVLPVWPAHQARVARHVERSLCQGGTPAVHIFQFPRVTINHGIILFAVQATKERLEFEGYDPNIPDRPVSLTYEHAAKAFSFQPTHYWPGGRLSVYEIYRLGRF